MWGICTDAAACGGRLYGAVAEYRMKDADTAVIIQPVPDAEIDIQSIQMLDAPPLYRYGDAVSPVQHPDRQGHIRAIFRHYKNGAYFYLIESGGKKISRRYYAEELAAGGK